MIKQHELEQRRARLTPEQRQRLARRIQTGNQTAQQQVQILRQPDTDPVPLSYAQQRHWFLWQLEPQSTAYHLSAALRLSGELNVAALQTSFRILVQRHESLRTVCRANAHGQAQQEIEAAGDFALRTIDLSDLPIDSRQQRATQEARQIITTPFDLTQGPLLRVAVIRLDVQEHHLIVAMHHIISDAWSNRIIIDELAACYRACLMGEPPQLPELPVQYADYAVWQRNWLEAGEKERQLAYWRTQLGDTHKILQLPVDHARLPVNNYRAAQYNFQLPAPLAAGLRRMAQERGITLFMVLLCGFQMLLYRYSGQNDIRVGVPVANRQRAEAERIVGLFVNTQVLCNRIDSRMTLAAILDQTRDAALGAQTYQDLPFEHLVEALQPERSLHQNPLFQVMFNHLREDYRALYQLPGLTVSEFEPGERGAQFELVLDTVEKPDGQIDARFTYAAELFEADTIQRLSEHYLCLLRQLADNPLQCLGDVNVLSKMEWTQLNDWGVNARHYADVEPVHRLIERRVMEQPDAVALIFQDNELSYMQLNQRANRLAHHLIALGVKPESRVGIALERSIDMVVALLAVLKAGGAYVPLDPDYPAERLQHMIADSGIELLLTQSHVRAKIPCAEHCPVLELDTLTVTDNPADNPDVTLHPEHLAYIIYTSGSTGKPKGAMNRHGALHNRLVWMQKAFPIGTSDTVLQKTPFSFDVSVWEFFWPLMYGARLVIANPGDHRDAERLIGLIRRHHVTLLHFVPSMLRAFMTDTQAATCTNLKYIICSGEALQTEMQQAVFDRLPTVRLHNLYGPTEAAIDVTHWACRPESSINIPIGRPISATQTYILDSDLNPVPSGVAGELYLGGAGLARGYLSRPGLTAERFVAALFGNQGKRLYRTGDLARWRRDGQIEYLGRLDHQVKIRGFRIELGEIEVQLLQQPEIREAVVSMFATGQDARLVAYISLHAGKTVDVVLLNEALRKTLPDYMLPSAVVILDRLPLNANGKIDRNRLPMPEFANVDDYEPPQGETEQLLAGIWQEVLGIGRAGRNDHFFRLGGHSLLILQVQQRVQSKHPVSFPLRLLFEHPVLKDMASVVHAELCKNIDEPGALGQMAELLNTLEN
ncbi:non-ribosomal peptide synthetase [Nitrosomonas oligotropha]|uniref:Amino acid adenylation domain-containing protein n=1 Tax=Nitrosomonas oligotropha TaxID=42354 RepID=A0A1H8PZG7_9PROT|nr:non-ribosomal peptide synthetase [Nitrosomonas oligotropha]SDW67294.1 amino acid adenylation domain-containing protein [Nitrosomonas oligotropha]SEO47389.1 amino acid adenylation domain-containing protein [Nitrosomonas oligotropha]